MRKALLFKIIANNMANGARPVHGRSGIPNKAYDFLAINFHQEKVVRSKIDRIKNSQSSDYNYCKLLIMAGKGERGRPSKKFGGHSGEASFYGS